MSILGKNKFSIENILKNYENYSGLGSDLRKKLISA